MITTIDTHKFIKEFIKASKNKNNTAEKQAEIIVNMINENQEVNFQKLVTKRDLKRDLELVEQKLINKIAVMLTIAVGVIAWLDKIIT